ncbi:MAG: 3-deoxy-D-manno-octulosonic acid transferase [Verrucomicrobia bacterium]|nr:3-deoxy-D-manno-octulosonic acid transferase [Verrucomicrobiota bacterium]
MIWIYRLLFFPVFILSVPWVLWHVKRRGGYGKDLTQRFGNIPGSLEKTQNIKRIWIQAVSVGEVRALRSFLTKLDSEKRVEVFLTATTSTGYKIAKDNYSELIKGIYYFPIDFPLFNRKTWNRIQPDLCILTEGELWPEHIHTAKMRGVPIVLINARMSDSTLKTYLSLRGLAKSIFKSLDLIIASSEGNAKRFRKLGCAHENTKVAGNLKCDIPIPDLLSEDERNTLAKELGLPLRASTDSNTVILCGASTWPGEEAALFKISKQLRSEGIDLRLIVTPRHAERKKEIKTDLEPFDLSSHFRSDGPAEKVVEISIADTTGELHKFLQLSDLVFVGKSLPPHKGGQTPIEAGMLKKPILLGPGMSNFRDIANSLIRFGIAIEVQDEQTLENAIRTFCLDPNRSQNQSEKADDWLKANQGATERTLQFLSDFL